MKRATAYLRLSLVFLLLLLMISASPLSDHTRATVDGEVVLIAGELIDVKWDPSGYPNFTNERFMRWELRGGLDAEPNLDKIASGRDRVTGFFRHRKLDPDATYRYELHLIYCVEPCGPGDTQNDRTVFTDTATTGFLQGTVYQPLTLEEELYLIGFGGAGSSAALYVDDNASLTAGKNTTITVGVGISSSSVIVKNGSAFIDGADLVDVSIVFGEYQDPNSGGFGWVKNTEIENGNVILYGHSDVQIYKNSGTFGVVADFESKAMVQENEMTGDIEVQREAQVTIQKNEITNGEIQVSGYGTTSTPKAAANIYDNILRSAFQNDGVSVDYGAKATIVGNSITYTNFHGSESSILISASDAGTELIAHNNVINHGKVAAFWGPTVDIRDNVISGGGSAITIGCVVCGTGNQATGSILRNTVQNGWGFEMWDGSQDLTIRHNCIRGNNPGLTVVSTLPVPLDVRNNYWNSDTGPTHPTNPGGQGDRIEGNQVSFTPWDPVGTYCRSTPPPPNPDLRIAGLEIVQAIQDLGNSVPLVTGKPAVVRLYPDVSTGVVDNVTVKLEGFRDGSSLGLLTSEPASIQVRPLGDLKAVRASELSDLLYRVPATWLSGNVTFIAEINPTGAISETNYENNFMARAVSFTPRRAMRIGLAPIRLKTGLFTYEEPDRSLFPAMYHPLRQIFPTHQVTFEILPAFTWNVLFPTEAAQDNAINPLFTGLNQALANANGFRPAENKIDQIVGIFPGDPWQYLHYCAAEPRWWAASDTGRTGIGRSSFCHLDAETFAHEVGHNLGLRHPDTEDACGAENPQTDWPYGDATTQEIGYDTLFDLIIRPSEAHDIMSYCPGITKIGWIAPYHYQKMFDGDLQPVPYRSFRADPDISKNSVYLIIRGEITTGDQVTFYPFWQMDLVDPPENPTEGTGYCLELRDSGASVLDSFCFDPNFYVFESGGFSNLDTFEIALPYQAATERVVLRTGAVDLAEVAVSANPPDVTMLFPNGGESLSGSVDVSWSGSDADGDTLAYNLLYSPDNGINWLPVTGNLTTTTTTLDLTQIPGGDQALLRIRVSDGYHTAQDDSDGAFHIEDNSPLTTILSPEDGAETYLPVFLLGFAYDFEDGELVDASLTWTSDRDGLLGTGGSLNLDNLSIGQHTLTFAAQDSQGSVTSTTVTITILEPPPIFLPIILKSD